MPANGPLELDTVPLMLPPATSLALMPLAVAPAVTVTRVAVDSDGLLF